MNAESEGTVVTFYSYKGGTGRTMALANVAWILAANGKRVLVVDWDLESPGLHRFFAPFMERDALLTQPGVIDLIQQFQTAKQWEYEGKAGTPSFETYADPSKYAIALDWSHFPEGGRVDFLSAGKQNKEYAAVLGGINWDDFYEMHDGGRFFDHLRNHMRQNYDYTLIDSRTGYSDVADICTVHLPDILVDCFTLSEQGIEGASSVARAIQQYENRGIRILPVPMRVDPAEKDKADAGRGVAQKRFVGLPVKENDEQRQRYWEHVEVPYQAYYAYEEVLAVFGDSPGVPGRILYAYEYLTSEITEGKVRSLPAMEPKLKKRVIDQFQRKPIVAETDITLRYLSEDRVWAEWLHHILVAAGVRVSDPWSGDVVDTTRSRDLMIVSPSFAAGDGQELPPTNSGIRSALAVYVADLPLVPRVPPASSVSIAGLAEAPAIERVLTLIGRPDAMEADVATNRPRYPLNEPSLSNLQARNTRFTGREADLKALRQQLRAGGSVVVSGAQPVALQGMGGIGKTQVALEYAHRFQSAYDLIWWISAEPVAFIDSQLGDLGKRLGIVSGPTPDVARTVLQHLGKRDTSLRWLLIFDNAEDPQRVGEFLPSGPGHVLITSRDSSWGDRAQTLQVDVFEREESVAHMRARLDKAITFEEANRLAELLGDLPIAVAAATALLYDTGFAVSDYLQQIELKGPQAILLPDQPADDKEPQTVAGKPTTLDVVWNLSLQRLRGRSPGAYRMLQLLSVMDSSIPLQLVHGDELANALVRYDSSVAERLVRGKLVQELNRLSLVRIEQRSERQPGDRGGGRISVHRLVQHVVRSRMSDEELGEARHQMHVVLARSRPSGEVDDPDNWPRFRLLWPHLEVSGAVRCSDEAVRQLLVDRVRFLWLVGDYERGLDRGHQAESVWLERLGAMADNPEISDEAQRTMRRQLLHLRFNMANILRSLGRFEDSREIDEKVLADQQELLGPEHAHSLMTAGGLAADLRGLGHYDEALRRDLVTHRAWLDIYGEENPRTLAALNNLGTSYRLMGNFARALELDEMVFHGRQNVLGDRHPSTLLSAGHIGRDLREAGEYERSVTQLTVVHESYVDTLGREHRETINAGANLAISLRSAGRAQEAAEWLDDAFDRLRVGVPFGPDTLACRLSRAINLLAMNAESANLEMTAVHDAYRSRLGTKHPHTVVCVNNLAMILRADGRLKEARKLAQEAASAFAELLGANHPYTLGAETNLAVCTAESGRPRDALNIVSLVVPRITHVLGPEHPDTLRCLADEAMIKLLLDDADQQENLSTIGRRLAARIGTDHPALSALGDRHLLHRVIDPQPF